MGNKGGAGMGIYRLKQQAVCLRFGQVVHSVSGGEKLGVSSGVLRGGWPLHGVRTPPENDTCGWYIWSGEFSQDSSFFNPTHARHLFEGRPEVAGYLGLPPGWRFLITPDYEDVWFDESALRPPQESLCSEVIRDSAKSAAPVLMACQ